MAEERSQVSVNDEYIEKYGFHEAENYSFKSRKGLDLQNRERYFAHEEGAGVDDRLPSALV